MDFLDLSNPVVLIVGGALLLAVLYFWNKANTSRASKRRRRSFRTGYYERKEGREKDQDNPQVD